MGITVVHSLAETSIDAGIKPSSNFILKFTTSKIRYFNFPKRKSSNLLLICMDIPKNDRPFFMDATIRISPINAGFFHIYCRKFRKVLILDLPILISTVQNFQLQESLCLCCLKVVMSLHYKHLSSDSEMKFFTKACSNKWENHWVKEYFFTSSSTRSFISTLKTIKNSKIQPHK